MLQAPRFAIAVAAVLIASLAAPAGLAADERADGDTGAEDVRVVAGVGSVAGSIHIVGSVLCAVAGVAEIEAVQGPDGVWNATYTLTSSCISYEDRCSERYAAGTLLTFDCLIADRIVLDGVDGGTPADTVGFDLVIYDPVRPGVVEGSMTGVDVDPVPPT